MTWRLPIAGPLHPPAWQRPPGNAEYKVTSWFGWRTRNGRREWHNGIDLGNGAPAGAIYAVADGTVLAVGNLGPPWSTATTRWPSGNYGGLMVVLDHPGGKRSVYAHLANAYVTRGQRVSAGDRIGLEGDSGSAQGAAHLHFEIHDGTARVDPYPLITEDDMAHPIIGLLQAQLGPESNLRAGPATDSAARPSDDRTGAIWVDVLGIVVGGPWTVGDRSDTTWYEVEAYGTRYFVATALLPLVQLTKQGKAAVPIDVDCVDEVRAATHPLNERIAAAREALA